MRIGIFGGSFNPPHLGHLHLAESVHAALALDEVWLVPSGISPHRSMEAYAPAEGRYSSPSALWVARQARSISSLD